MKWPGQWSAVAALSVSVLRRSPGFLGMILLGVLAPGMGFWWQDFNFGTSTDRFLMSFGWGMQNLVGMVVAMAAALQVQGRIREDGLLPVWQARGVPAGAIVSGQFGAGFALAVGYALVSSLVVVTVVHRFGKGLELGAIWLAAPWLVAKLGLVVAMTLWFGRLGRGVGFVIVATLGLVLVGHLRPWASEVGGVALLLSWLSPDLAALGKAPWEAGRETGEMLRQTFGVLLYGVVFLWLAGRCRSEHDA